LHCCFCRPGSLHFDGHQGRAGQLPKPVTRGGDVVVDQNVQSRICNYCILLSGAPRCCAFDTWQGDNFELWWFASFSHLWHGVWPSLDNLV
jgi:hypothetical protein